MPTSIREQVLQAFQAKLETITGFSGLAVERNWDSDVVEFPFINIIDGDHDADNEFHDYTQYRMQVEVEAWHYKPDSEDTDNIGTKVNALYAAIVQKALSDVTLGNLSVNIKELNRVTDLNRGDGQVPVGACSILFEIEFWTAVGDPYTAGPA
jgi:hypothetical protein